METHCYAGFSVSPYYDPMIAKLIVRGETREEAIAKLRVALKEFQIDGIKTNIPFLIRLVDHPDYVAGKITTGFVGRMLSEVPVGH